jgi:hypothetical protein
MMKVVEAREEKTFKGIRWVMEGTQLAGCKTAFCDGKWNIK